MIFFGVSRLRFQRLYRLSYRLVEKEFSRELCDQERWGGEEDGREVQKGGGTYVYLWLIHVDVWQQMPKFCKAVLLQLKNNHIKNVKKNFKPKKKN